MNQLKRINSIVTYVVIFVLIGCNSVESKQNIEDYKNEKIIATTLCNCLEKQSKDVLNNSIETLADTVSLWSGFIECDIDTSLYNVSDLGMADSILRADCKIFIKYFRNE